jgi:uncharacterized protein YciI
MQFLIIFTRDPLKAGERTPAALREAEFEAVRGLYSESFVRRIWLRGDGAGACAIVEATSAADAEERASALPLVRAGLLQAPVIVPLKPYAGFAPRS